ncbi:unnamed protein product [Symbiodinium necroappetens]|uniref:VTT domain-containing protein n=1 Tax=Symbiodinium necroappetens TaxID=1628268 RepID=A0A812J5W2_9DINO|nr:unnamed protein product [Symbiodinium necroappetens]
MTPCNQARFVVASSWQEVRAAPRPTWCRPRWPRPRPRASLVARPFRQWLMEVQEGAQQLAASSKNLQTVDDLMGSLRRNPSMRRWICGIVCACIALYSLIPAVPLLALQVEDWQSLNQESFENTLRLLQTDYGGSKSMYFLCFLLNKLPWNLGFPPASDIQAAASAMFGSVISGSVLAAIFDTAAAVVFFFVGRFLCRLTTQGKQSPTMLALDAGRKLAEEDGLRLVLLLQLGFGPGAPDGAISVGMGALGVSPSKFVLGHGFGALKWSLELVSSGAAMSLSTLPTNGLQVELFTLLQLVLAVASAVAMTFLTFDLLDQFLGRLSARHASTWPSVEPVDVWCTLPTVDLASMKAPPTEPCLVSGYKVPFALQSLDDLLDPRYPCGDHPALMMYSPTGTFSSYAVEREVVQHADGLRFADGSPERPAHVHRMEDFGDNTSRNCGRPDQIEWLFV